MGKKRRRKDENEKEETQHVRAFSLDWYLVLPENKKKKDFDPVPLFLAPSVPFFSSFTSSLSPRLSVLLMNYWVNCPMHMLFSLHFSFRFLLCSYAVRERTALSRPPYMYAHHHAARLYIWNLFRVPMYPLSLIPVSFLRRFVVYEVHKPPPFLYPTR